MNKTLLALAICLCLFFLAPFQARADLSFTMTSFQSLGPLYASGEITGTLTGYPTVYSFCVENQALLYEGQPYAATLNSIAGNAGLLESAYLINTYVPQNSPLADVNEGVALQWAIWMLLDQASPLTDTSVQNPTLAAEFPTIYSQAQSYTSDALNQYNLGTLAPLAGEYQELDLQGSQDLLLVPTPLPAAAYMLGSGLLGLMGIRKRMLI